MCKVTVVMAAFNAGSYLTESIDSIVNQTYSNFELLVVDDGSTDESVSEVMSLTRDSRVRFFFRSNAGKAAAINSVLSEARGEFFAFQDSDDVSSPNRLEVMLAKFEEFPEMYGLFSGAYLIRDGRREAEIGRDRGDLECRAIMDRFRIPGHDPTAMFRMDIVRELGMNEELRIGQGWDLALRVGERGPIRSIRQPLYGYRVRGDSVTRADICKREYYRMRVLELALKRRGLSENQKVEQGKTASKDNSLSRWYATSVADFAFAGCWASAIGSVMQSFRYFPGDWSYVRPLLVLLKWILRLVLAKVVMVGRRSELRGEV